MDQPKRPGPRPRGCVLRALGFYALFLLFAAGLWLLGAHALAWWRLRQEWRAWADTGTSMDALRGRYPKAPDTASARELDRLTRRLGIYLLRDPEGSSQVRDKKLYDAATDYMRRLSNAPDDRPLPVPPELCRFLDEHRSELSAVADHLVSASGIAWETDIDAGPAAPIPSLLAHRSLQLVLLTEALERDRRGDSAGAHRFLDAAVRQNETLASRSDVISRLIAVALVGMQNSALRALPRPGPDWRRRLPNRHLREDLVAAFQPEAYSYFILWTRGNRGIADLEAEASPGVLTGGPGAGLVRVLSVPYVRLGAASISRHLRRVRTSLLAQDPCEMDFASLDRLSTSGISHGDVMARVTVPSLARGWLAGLVADMDSERTRLILEARERMCQRGNWGEPTAVPSRICGGVAWLHERARDGRLTIRPESLPNLDPNPRQWSFTLSPPRCGR